MAHLLDFTKNRPAIAYVGDKPWHGFGEKLDENEPIERWQIAAGLNWNIGKTAVRYQIPNGDQQGLVVLNTEGFCKERTMPSRQVLYRTDTGDPLSVVGDNYKVVQPEEILEFYRDLVATGDFQLHTAGALDGGRKIWALAKTGHQLRIKGQDQIDSYLLFATACDGTLATTVQFTSVRVVCHNTLSFSVDTEEGKDTTIKVPHCRAFDPNEVKQQLGLLGPSWRRFGEQAEQLAERKVSKNEAQQWLVDTFGDPSVDLEHQPNAQLMRGVYQLFDGHGRGSDLVSSQNTAWGLVNATTEFLDHHRRAHNNGTRMNSAWFGNGQQFKQKAFNNALKLAA